MKIKNIKKGFTLIELLIVIGILGVLVATVLLTIRPGDAQQVARDAQRIKDLEKIKTVLNLWLEDNTIPGNLANTITTNIATGVNSTNNASGTSCSSSWLGNNVAFNFCAYTDVIPIAPLNGLIRPGLTGGGTITNPTRANLPAPGFVYYARMRNSTVVVPLNPGDFELRTPLESRKNASYIFNDGGDDVAFYEIGNSADLAVL